MASISGWHGGLVLGVALASGTAWAGNVAPLLVIEWSINGGSVNVLVPGGGPAENGFEYQGIVIDPATGLELEYDIIGNPMSSVAGNVQIVNELGADITVAIDVRLSLDPDFQSETLLTGNVAVGLTSGPGGGQISSLPPALFRTLVDGKTAGFDTTLFWDPFLIASTGQGNAATQGHYGIPVPVPGPPLLSSLGYSLRYQLTPGDLASVSVQLSVGGETSFCTEDLDGSGAVNTEDLFALTRTWGPCPNPDDCAADLDVDNAVGVGDMLMLLQAWGPCQ